MAEEMQAIRVHEHGDPNVLRYESVERPAPTADELLVRVRGAGLNPVDTAGRYGQIEYPLPWIPGWDLSGTVAAVGDAVTDFEVGDDVYALARFPDAGNAYAEYATVPAADVATKPETIDYPTAAGVPMVALTRNRAEAHGLPWVQADESEENNRLLLYRVSIATKLICGENKHPSPR